MDNTTPDCSSGLPTTLAAFDVDFGGIHDQYYGDDAMSGDSQEYDGDDENDYGADAINVDEGPVIAVSTVPRVPSLYPYDYDPKFDPHRSAYEISVQQTDSC
ncbi:hypothetical protein Pelo_13297 [Pelomyxa schiedti]|nr:hypothetical protein Pelo_13297 [Pelomyxa schiedti]